MCELFSELYFAGGYNVCEVLQDYPEIERFYRSTLKFSDCRVLLAETEKSNAVK